MGSGPTIPSVTGSYSMPDTSLDMQQIQSLAFPNLGKAPSPTVVTASQAPVVNVPRALHYTPRGEAVPYDDTSQEKIRAHKSNTFREITNAVGAYAQRKSEEKTDALKTQISSVLAAQKRIAEANTVLQNDPNNANAKAVLDSNKKIMDGILSGKDSKAIQKAFDISFTDPTKNKTPEVKAMQEAMKEHATNHEAGHDINNPAEQKVQEQAHQPMLHARPDVPLNATSNTQNVIPASAQAKSPIVPAEKWLSSTPYAEQFLGKQALQLEANPQYAAYKEQSDKEQAAAVKILPNLMAAETRKAIAVMGAQNANARADARNFTAYMENAQRIQAQLKMQGMRDNAAFGRVVRQGQDAMARAMLHAEVAMGVSSDPRIKGTPLEKQLQMKALTQLQGDITKETSDLVKLQQQYEVAAQQKPQKGQEEQYAKTLEQMRSLIQYDQWNLTQLVDNRQKFTEQAFGKPLPSFDSQNKTPIAESSNKIDNTWTNLDGKGATKFVAAGNKDGKPTEQSAESAKPESVGQDNSDEYIPREEQDLDPDNYDN